MYVTVDFMCVRTFRVACTEKQSFTLQSMCHTNQVIRNVQTHLKLTVPGAGVSPKSLYTTVDLVNSTAILFSLCSLGTQ